MGVVAALSLGFGTLDTHGTDTHCKVVGKLSPKPDMRLFCGVIEVTDTKRLVRIVHLILWHLNLDPQASLFTDVTPLPLEDSIRVFNFFEIGIGVVGSAIHINLEAARVESSDVQRNWVGQCDAYAESSDLVDFRPDLIVSAHLGLSGANWEVFTFGSEFLPGLPYLEQLINSSLSVISLP